jgi:hypothetical protein
MGHGGVDGARAYRALFGDCAHALAGAGIVRFGGRDENDAPTEPKIIRFPGAAAHKYSFVSRSSNNHIFDLVSHEERTELSPANLIILRAQRSAAFGHLRLRANGGGSIARQRPRLGGRDRGALTGRTSRRPAGQPGAPLRATALPSGLLTGHRPSR